MRIPGKREAAPLEKRSLDILPGTNSDHGAGDLRVVREAAAEMASKLIRKVSDKNDTDAFRRVERDIISIIVNIGTVQLQVDDNGIKLRAICLKHYIAAFRRSEGAERYLEKSFRPLRPLGALLSIITTTTGHAAAAAARAHAQIGPLSLPSSFLPFPLLNQTTFIKAESERATMCVRERRVRPPPPHASSNCRRLQSFGALSRKVEERAWNLALP